MLSCSIKLPPLLRGFGEGAMDDAGDSVAAFDSPLLLSSNTPLTVLVPELASDVEVVSVLFGWAGTTVVVVVVGPELDEWGGGGER